MTNISRQDRAMGAMMGTIIEPFILGQSTAFGLIVGALVSGTSLAEAAENG
jgi:hypothetical protein